MIRSGCVSGKIPALPMAHDRGHVLHIIYNEKMETELASKTISDMRAEKFGFSHESQGLGGTAPEGCMTKSNSSSDNTTSTLSPLNSPTSLTNTPSSVSLHRDFMFMCMSMYNDCVDKNFMRLVNQSNIMKYLLYETNYLSMNVDLDQRLLTGQIESRFENPDMIRKVFLKDKENAPTYLHCMGPDYRHDIAEDSYYEIVEQNTFIDNRILFHLRAFAEPNFTRAGQYDSAISIFNIEKTGWDATSARLKRNIYESYKMDVMRNCLLSNFNHLNFMRETIGRVVVMKNPRTTLMKANKLQLFAKDTSKNEDYKTQLNEYCQKHPLGFKEEPVNPTHINIGRFEFETAKKMAEKMTKMKVLIFGFDTPGIEQIQDNEVYVSRASDIGEFYFEFKCLVGYCMCNTEVQTIYMVNPLLSNETINKGLTDRLVYGVTYTNKYLPLIITYQHLVTQPEFNTMGEKINNSYSDDYFAFLKMAALTKMKINTRIEGLVSLLDFTKLGYSPETVKKIKTTDRDKYMAFQDSYYQLRVLDVLGLVVRNNTVRVPTPRLFVQVRYYMKEFAKNLAINADYIVQRCIGSYENYSKYGSTFFDIMEQFTELMFFVSFGGNVMVDVSGNVTNIWTKNPIIWHETYVKKPLKEEELGIGLSPMFKVTKRLDWFNMKTYVNVGAWNFGNIYKGLDVKENNMRDVHFNLTDDYRAIRNTVVRGYASNPRSVKLSYRDGRDVSYMHLDIHRAICSTLGAFKCKAYYYYFCEIPSLAVFGLATSFFVQDLYYNGTLPVYSYGWVNVVNSYNGVKRGGMEYEGDMDSLFLKGQ